MSLDWENIASWEAGEIALFAIIIFLSILLLLLLLCIVYYWRRYNELKRNEGKPFNPYNQSDVDGPIITNDGRPPHYAADSTDYDDDEDEMDEEHNINPTNDIMRKSLNDSHFNHAPVMRNNSNQSNNSTDSESDSNDDEDDDEDESNNSNNENNQDSNDDEEDSDVGINRQKPQRHLQHMSNPNQMRYRPYGVPQHHIPHQYSGQYHSHQAPPPPPPGTNMLHHPNVYNNNNNNNIHHRGHDASKSGTTTTMTSLTSMTTTLDNQDDNNNNNNLTNYANQHPINDHLPQQY